MAWYGVFMHNGHVHEVQERLWRKTYSCCGEVYLELASKTDPACTRTVGRAEQGRFARSGSTKHVPMDRTTIAAPSARTKDGCRNTPVSFGTEKTRASKWATPPKNGSIPSSTSAPQNVILYVPSDVSSWTNQQRNHPVQSKRQTNGCRSLNGFHSIHRIHRE